MKKFLCIILCLAMLVSVLPSTVFAADIASGSGWKIDSAGTLHLTGKITNYSEEFDNYVPWKSHALKIKNVVAEKGASINNARYLFYECTNLVSADLRLLSCSSVTDAGRMFYNCESLTSVNLSGVDFSHVTDAVGAFRGCKSLKSVDLTPFTNASLTDAAIMFKGCSSLASIDLTPFRNSKIENFGEIFSYCESLTAIDLSPLNTENTWEMAYMFRKCTSLKELDLSFLSNNPNLHSMQGMFEDCSALEKINLVGFDTSKVTNMLNLFSGCHSLKELDLTGFNTSNVTEAYWMFKDCSSLKTLDLSGFDTRKMIRMEDLTEGCSSLEELDVSSFRFEDDIHYGINNFVGCDSLRKISISVPYLRLIADELLKFSPTWMNAETNEIYRSRYDLIKIAFAPTLIKTSNVMGDGWHLDEYGVLHITGAVKYTVSADDNTPWKEYKNEIKEVVTEKGASVNNCKSLFENCPNLVSADLSNLNTVSVTDMSTMFMGCSSLKTLDLSSLTTVNVTDMSRMFSGCTSLVSVDLTGLNTVSVNSMDAMFEYCSALVSVDVSNFAIKNTTTLGRMFSSCSKLGCVKTNRNVLRETADQLIAISSSWYNGETSEKYTTASQLRAITGKATLVTASIIGTGWFIDSADCLHIIGAVSNPTVAGGRDRTPWTSYKTQIKSVICETGASIDNCRGLFSGCDNLVSADFSKLDTTKVSDMSNMFLYCANLSYINFGEVNLSNVSQAENIFKGTDELSKITASGSVLTKLAAPIFGVYYQWNDRASGKTYANAADFKTVTGVVTIIKDYSVTYGNGWYIDAAYALHLTGPVTNPSTSSDNTPWKDYKDIIVEVIAEDGSSINCGTFLFGDMPNLIAADIHRLNTSGVADFDSMFQYCPNLVAVNLDGIDTSSATMFMGMFIGCQSLESVDLSSLNTENVGNMLGMFANCTSLKEINIGSFSANGLYGEFALYGMFAGCPSIRELTVSPGILSLAASQLIEESVSWTDKKSGTIYYSESDLKSVSKTVTLVKGLYSPLIYLVTYYMNGHGTAPEMLFVSFGATVKKPVNPTASGYTFGGWYEDSDLTNLYDFTKPIDKDTVIFAKWTKTEPVVYPAGKGDLNFDGKINAIDSNMMKRILIGDLEPNAKLEDAADINSDTKINAIDASLLLIMLIGG